MHVEGHRQALCLSGTLAAKPVVWETRVDSAEYVWSLQRRVGLYVTAALPTFTELREQLGIVYDPLGDTLVHEKETDKSAPHHAGVRMLYKMAQSTATHTVVMGDQERADVCPTPYRLSNRRDLSTRTGT